MLTIVNMKCSGSHLERDACDREGGKWAVGNSERIHVSGESEK